MTLSFGGDSEVTLESTVVRLVTLLKSNNTFILNISVSSQFLLIVHAFHVCFFQSGLIRVSQEEFLIAPLPQHLAEQHNYSAPDGHHPHVVYKRSAEHIIHRRSTSPSSTSSSGSDNPYLQHHHQQQHHQHHDYQHGKLQRQHFCGRRKQCM